ncbi:MAG: hypothetical protein NC930_08160, partial [Candidatus Omnitrophica bacterium]|nr:hypothetical protein [Candidatus Omnitrophota bacterium]
LVWLGYIQAWILVGLGSLPGQDLYQRILAPKNETVARWSAILSGLLYVLVGMLPVLMGIYGRIAFPGGRSSSILIDLSLKYLPGPFMGVMVGALLSAIMSTVSAALLAPASIIGHNIIPYLKPGVSNEVQLKWCKWSILFVGISSLILALYFRNIYTLCTYSWGVLLVGVVAPMIAGVYWKRANTYGAVAGAVCGPAAWIFLTIFLPEGYPTNLFGFLASWGALVIVSLATGRIQSGPRRCVTFSTESNKPVPEVKQPVIVSSV